MTELERQGFIRKSSSNGTLVVVREQESVTDARSKYLDPLARILDYVGAIRSRLIQAPDILTRITNAQLSTTRSRTKRLHTTERRLFRKLLIDTRLGDHSIRGRLSLSWTSGCAKTHSEAQLSDGVSILNEARCPASLNTGNGRLLQSLVQASRRLEQDER